MRRPSSLELLESLPESAAQVVLVLQPDPTTEEELAPGEVPAIGVLADVLTRGSEEALRTLEVRGLTRVRLASPVRANPFLQARVARCSVPDAETQTQLARKIETAAGFLLETFPADVREALAAGHAERAVDCIAAHLDHPPFDVLQPLIERELESRCSILFEVLEYETTRQRGLQGLLETLDREHRQLWVLEEGAQERIDEMFRAGVIEEQEARDLAHFAETGYVVWERLIDPEAIDRLVQDIRHVYQHPGKFLTTDHRRSKPFRFSGKEPDAFESLFDLYVHLESARAPCFHPRIVRFLELVFETPPIAIQQLLFQRSNGHQAHQDTAFVCVEQPLLLAATWIALEDVVAGRGELTYYSGSHKIEPYRFRDGSRRFNEEHDDAGEMQRELLARVQASGCEKRDFLAKKGDVFLWAADLVHASNPRTRPGRGNASLVRHALLLGGHAPRSSPT